MTFPSYTHSCTFMSDPLVTISVSEGSDLSPPPTNEVLGMNSNSSGLQSLGREMTVIGSLNTGIGIVALCVCLHAIQRVAHNLSEELADLILRILILRRELQDRWETRFVIRSEVLCGDVCSNVSC